MSLLNDNDLVFGVYFRYGFDLESNPIGEELIARFVFERDARDFCKLYTRSRDDDVSRVYYKRLDNEN